MTDFFNSVGMEYVVIGLAAALLLALILVIVALVKVGKLKKRYEKFLSGKDGKSLEESIVKRFDKLNEIIVEQDFLEQEILHSHVMELDMPLRISETKILYLWH